MKKLISVTLALLMILSLVACGAKEEPAPEKEETKTETPAPEKEEKVETVVYRYAELAETNHPATEIALYFAERVKELSGGRMIVEVYDNAQLGAEKEAVQGVQMGSIDFARGTATLLADFNMPMLNVLGLPYTFSGRDHAWEVLGGEIGAQIKEYAAEADNGLVGVFFEEEGFRNVITVDGPITKMSDLAGRKIRVNNANLMVDTVNAMGASAVPMAYTEVYTSLQSGVVEGLENIAAGYNSAAHYEVAPYYAMTRHICSCSLVVANQDMWNELSDEDRGIFEQAAADTEVFAKECAQKFDDAAMTELTEKGAKINEVENPQEWADALQSVTAKYGEGFEDIIAAIAALK